MASQLSAYDLFVPCGITDKGVTSVSKLLGRSVSVEEIKPLLIECFAEVFSFDKISRADDLSPEWKKEIERRCREIDEGTVALSSAEDVFERAYARLS